MWAVQDTVTHRMVSRILNNAHRKYALRELNYACVSCVIHPSTADRLAVVRLKPSVSEPYTSLAIDPSILSRNVFNPQIQGSGKFSTVNVPKELLMKTLEENIHSVSNDEKITAVLEDFKTMHKENDAYCVQHYVGPVLGIWMRNDDGTQRLHYLATRESKKIFIDEYVESFLDFASNDDIHLYMGIGLLLSTAGMSTMLFNI